MNWYLCQLVFKVEQFHQTRKEISLRVICADDLRTAFLQSEQLGKELQHEQHPGQIHWEFLGIGHISDTAAWSTGSEVFSTETALETGVDTTDYYTLFKEQVLAEAHALVL